MNVPQKDEQHKSQQLVDRRLSGRDDECQAVALTKDLVGDRILQKRPAESLPRKEVVGRKMQKRVSHGQNEFLIMEAADADSTKDATEDVTDGHTQPMAWTGNSESARSTQGLPHETAAFTALSAPALLSDSTYDVFVATSRHGQGFFLPRQGYLCLSDHLILMLSALPDDLCRALVRPLLRGTTIAGSEVSEDQELLRCLFEIAQSAPANADLAHATDASRVAAAWIHSFLTGCVGLLVVNERKLVVSRYWTAPRKWFSSAELVELSFGCRVAASWMDDFLHCHKSIKLA